MRFGCCNNSICWFTLLSHLIRIPIELRFDFVGRSTHIHISHLHMIPFWLDHIGLFRNYFCSGFSSSWIYGCSFSCTSLNLSGRQPISSNKTWSSRSLSLSCAPFPINFWYHIEAPSILSWASFRIEIIEEKRHGFLMLWFQVTLLNLFLVDLYPNLFLLCLVFQKMNLGSWWPFFHEDYISLLSFSAETYLR